MSSLRFYQDIILTSMSGIVGLLTLTIGFTILDKFVPEQDEAVQWLMLQEEEQHSIQEQLRSIGTIASKSTMVSNIQVAAQKQIEEVPPKEEIPAEEVVYIPIDWMPPTWFPQESVESLWSLEQLNQPPKYDKGPKIYSRAAFVVDIDSGEVLWEKNPDGRRAVASLTKLVSSLTLMALDADLERNICLDRTMEPSFSGANTRFVVDGCTTGWDMLGAALLSSDNGAAYGYAQVADLEHSLFATEMNIVAQQLRMSESSFVDPAGIHDENISTARDITKVSIAAAAHPELSIATGARSWHANVAEGNEKVFNSTNKLLWRDIDWLVAKTGFTNTARAGFTGVYEQNGRRIAITTLGAWYPSRRWKDVNSIINWVSKH